MSILATYGAPRHLKIMLLSIKKTTNRHTIDKRLYSVFTIRIVVLPFDFFFRNRRKRPPLHNLDNYKRTTVRVHEFPAFSSKPFLPDTNGILHLFL